MKELLKYLALRMDTNRPVSREELAIYISTIDMTNESHFKEEIIKLYETAKNIHNIELARGYKKNIIDNEINNSNIGLKFQEDMIDDLFYLDDDDAFNL
jgi:hypothetical protein